MWVTGLQHGQVTWRVVSLWASVSLTVIGQRRLRSGLGISGFESMRQTMEYWYHRVKAGTPEDSLTSREPSSWSPCDHRKLPQTHCGMAHQLRGERGIFWNGFSQPLYVHSALCLWSLTVRGVGGRWRVEPSLTWFPWSPGAQEACQILVRIPAPPLPVRLYPGPSSLLSAQEESMEVVQTSQGDQDQI